MIVNYPPSQSAWEVSLSVEYRGIQATSAAEALQAAQDALGLAIPMMAESVVTHGSARLVGPHGQVFVMELKGPQTDA